MQLISTLAFPCYLYFDVGGLIAKPHEACQRKDTCDWLFVGQLKQGGRRGHSNDRRLEIANDNFALTKFCGDGDSVISVLGIINYSHVHESNHQ
jgi:hypothetical protein